MLKDQKLDEFAQRGVNIAQFVSYAPDGKKRYSRIRGISPTHRFASVEQAIQAILATGAPYVNIRSFLPNRPDGNPFFMGHKEKWPSLTDAANVVRMLLSRGFHVIINEDINVNDGGFSGVVIGEIAEFAPCDTPRCVEKPGCAILPRLVMDKLVYAVYGRRVGFPYSRNHRIEFSVHPGPVGYLRQPYIMWQEEKIEPGTGPLETPPRWPNRYSEIMGDKAYGLLIAHLYGFRVPHARVTGRLIPPFEFGEFTSSQEAHIVRTCPRAQVPGKFITNRGWLDPFELLQREEYATNVVSIIEEDTADAAFSGAALTDAVGMPVIEGVVGTGDDFMVGKKGTTAIPVHVADAVTHLWEKATHLFGPVCFEWVYDIHSILWMVQFHCGKTDSLGTTIYPGKPKTWVDYDTTKGLEGLRTLLEQAQHKGFGIVLHGDIGITSHFGDILRRAKVPSRLEREPVSV